MSAATANSIRLPSDGSVSQFRLRQGKSTLIGAILGIPYSLLILAQHALLLLCVAQLNTHDMHVRVYAYRNCSRTIHYVIIIEHRLDKSMCEIYGIRCL